MILLKYHGLLFLSVSHKNKQTRHALGAEDLNKWTIDTTVLGLHQVQFAAAERFGSQTLLLSETLQKDQEYEQNVNILKPPSFQLQGEKVVDKKRYIFWTYTVGRHKWWGVRSTISKLKSSASEKLQRFSTFANCYGSSNKGSCVEDMAASLGWYCWVEGR